LSTNPPDSVKRFTIKKSIIGAFDSAAPTNNSGSNQNPSIILGNLKTNPNNVSGFINNSNSG
jgi:hypothetical protein